MPHLLIFDDDAMTRDVLAAAALEREFTVVQAGSVKDALLQLDMRPPDLMLADISRFGEDGLAVCRDVIDAGGQLITLCSQGSIDTAVQALRIGAKDYLVKPLEGWQVATLLDEFSGGGVADGGAHCGRILGESAVMQEVYTQLRRAAPTDVSVLLIGESGTGKELAAEAIHQLSQRSKEKFVAVNCGAISPNLIESELFGHERGSFTGADRQHKGYFEQADGGTLFLDEITEMPIALQVKLLRVLETGRFMRVGNHQEQSCDVRVIAATNRDPLQAIQQDFLREDLYYRLAVFPVALPSLRTRGADVLILADAFLARLNRDNGCNRQFSDAIRNQMLAYSWPGNVRELHNYVSRAFVMAEGGELCAPLTAASPEAAGWECASTPTHSDDLAVLVGSTLAEVDRWLILATLKHCGGVRKLTAEMLGVSPKTLYNRLEAYGAQDEGLPG